MDLSKIEDQLRRRGYMPTDEAECVFRLMEEVGEVAEALREGHSQEDLAAEMIDVIWQVKRLAILKGIDLDEAFESKYEFNEKRPKEGG